MSSASPPAVAVDELRVHFGPVNALNGVSWRAEAGEITAILGPNGAGKSTTFACIEGYLRPDSGRVSVLGLDPVDDRRRIVTQVGVMLQSGGIPPAIRCAELLDQYRGFFPTPKGTDEMLERVGLEQRRSSTWRSLSGGEQQRLALALALIGSPRLVILDEPTSGIDAQGRSIVREVLVELRDAGVGVILSTHDLADAELLADHLVIVNHGATVASGRPHELLEAEQPDTFRIHVRGTLDAAHLSNVLGVGVLDDGDGRYTVATPPTPQFIHAVTGALADQDRLLDELVTTRRRLEDVFIALTSDESTPPDHSVSSRRRASSRTHR